MAEEDIKTHDAMNSLLGSSGRLLFQELTRLSRRSSFFTVIYEWKSVSELT